MYVIAALYTKSQFICYTLYLGRFIRKSEKIFLKTRLTRISTQEDQYVNCVFVSNENSTGHMSVYFQMLCPSDVRVHFSVRYPVYRVTN